MKLPPTISASDRQYAQLRAAQRIAQIGSWELNIPDNSLNWSEETYRIFGISPTVSDITADNFFAVVHPEDIHDVLDAYHHARNTESNIDIVNRIVRPDGEVRHLHSRAEYQVDARGVARLCGTVQDVTARVVSEQKLTDSDHLLKFASAMVRMGTWNVDMATSRVTWSDEVCDIHEVPRGTVPTVAQAMDFYLPDSRAALELAFAECATAGAPFDMELQVVTATGHGLWVRAVGQAVRAEDGGITRVRGAFQDITTIKHAHQEALRVAGRLTNTFESLTEAFVMLDADWCFTYVNAEAERLLQRQRGDLIGKYIWGEFADAVDSFAYHEYRRARADKVAVSFEQFYAPLGVWLEARAFPSDEGLAVYFRDVTERHVAEDALRESQERFKIVAKATADTIWDWDLKTDSIWWNESIHTVYGFSVGELEPDSSSWTNRIHPGDKEGVLHGIHAVIDAGKEKWSDQYRFLRKDGSYAYVLDRGFVIRNTEGEAVRMVGSITDLTAQKQTEMELARLNRALQLRGGCDDIINHVADEMELLAAVCRLAVTTGGYRLAWIGYAIQDEVCSVAVQASAGQQEDLDYVAALRLSWSDATVAGRGPVGRTLRSGMPLAMDDILLIDEFAPWLPAAQDRQFHGVMNLALRHQERTFGVMVLYSHGTLQASNDEMKLLQEMADNLAYGIENLRAREERRLIQSAVSKVAASFSVSAGAEFFERLVTNMNEAVGSQAGFVSRLLPGEPLRARTMAAVVDNQVRENFDYSLAGAPCEVVYRTGECVVTDNVDHRFKDAPGYLQVGEKAYVGRRLDNSAGHPIGLLFVLFREPIKRFDLISSTVQIFASRIAAELERVEADARIREQAALLDKAKDAIVVKGMDHRVRFWNKGAERLYKWTAEEAIGRSVDELLLEDPSELKQATEHLLQHGRWSGESIERCKDGSLLTIENHWTLVSDERGAPQSIFAIKTDITQRKADEVEIHHLAFYDPLTGLPNRRLLVERLTERLKAENADGHNGALLFVDLDNFKVLNDSFGHDQGDELLRQVAQRIKGCVRERDTVARLGGDEFVIILDRLASASREAAAQATTVAEKVLAAFNHPFELSMAEFYSTPSLGIALFDDKQSANELLKLADMAMYQAKAAGRNTLRFFDPAMQAVVAARVTMESELRQALQRQELLLHFQPQVDALGRVTGAEALTRWRHPVRGMVSPLEFIPLAEATGLILPLGEWVLRGACLQLAAWAADPLLSKLSLAVNVSARQFRHPDFLDRALAIMRETRTDPGKLKMELTESLLLDNVEDTIDRMAKLKSYGVGFALDDFGTGYSSLMYLKRLPLDQLKIDQSFVRDVLIDPNDAAIARTIVALGKSLGLDVIAEGVETEAQRAFLAAHGCTEYQGYLFSKPLPITEFNAFVVGQQA